MTFIERVCQAFAEAKVAYAVVGGQAVALHGAPRGTVDIDFVIRWNRLSLMKTFEVLSALGLVSRLPITPEDVFMFRDEYIENRNLIAWNFYNPDALNEQVDILINYDLTNKSVRRIKLGELTVPILGIDELIEMKREAGREQDMADISALERLRDQ